MAKGKQIKCEAIKACINPVTRRYTYKGESYTFTIGKGFQLEKIPPHWKESKVVKVNTVPPEPETLLEMQIKDMSAGKISQYIMIHYGVKIDTGQAKETAFHQAIELIRNPQIRRRPDAEIMAGLAALEDSNLAKEKGPDEIPSGFPAAVVPAKGCESAAGSESKENAAAPGEKLFKDLTPDEIDVLSRDDIFAKVTRMYKVEMANAGNKTVVLNKAYDIENAALETAAIKDMNQ